MDYYYLKIGHGNSLANDWLAGRNPLNRPAAPVFFDNLSEHEYVSGKGGKEPREFVSRGESKNRDRTLMVVVHEGEVYVLKPAGRVKFLPTEPSTDGNLHTPKAMPVDLLARKESKDVPPVLAGIGVNQFYSRGTFRRINDWGNFKAIDCVAGRVGKGEHWIASAQGPDQFLECLGCTEIETLVAKLFEAHGCFVPAYRGGTMKDIDLFACNDTRRPIQVGAVLIPAFRRVSIQVKRWAHGMSRPKGVDCLVGIGVTGPNTLDAARLLDLVQTQPTVRAWLSRSLDWLPDALLGQFRLHENVRQPSRISASATVSQSPKLSF